MRAENPRGDPVALLQHRAVTVTLEQPERALVDRAHLDPAIGALHRAVGLDPGCAAAWYHLAVFSEVVGDRVSARRARAQYLVLSAGDGPTAARARLILDHAWDLRDDGRHAQCLAWLAHHHDELGAAPRAATEGHRPPVGRPHPGPTSRQGLAPAVEVDLLIGLVAAEAGDATTARRQIARLPRLELFRAGHHLDSPQLRNWIHLWLAHRDRDRATLADRAVRLKGGLPPHLAWRYWQDLGLMCEAMGLEDVAVRCWKAAWINRPYLAFFPMSQRWHDTGPDGPVGADARFALSYRTFFTVGSVWGHAVWLAYNAQHLDPATHPDVWAEAHDRLEVCQRRGLQPDRARILQARLHLVADDPYTAWDLLAPIPDDRFADDATLADLSFLRGVAALHTGRNERAVDDLARCARLRPRDARAWGALGVARAQQDDTAGAVAAFGAMIDLEPRRGTGHYNRGLLHLEQGDFAAAEHDLRRAAELMGHPPHLATLLQAAATEQRIRVAPAAMSQTRLTALVGVGEGAGGTTGASGANDARGTTMARGTTTARGGPHGPHAALDRLLDQHAAIDPTLELAALPPAERALWREVVARRFELDPTPDSRLALARAHAAAGDRQAVEDLLGTLWPDRLTPSERALLLTTDREAGHLDRALALASGAVPVGADDAATVVPAVVALMDHGRLDEARALLTRGRDAAPTERALDELASRLGVR